tara:strand:+ start:195 stop:2195 length:2001 start_codon:yes stop_codon:yes gene_type:complete
MALPIRLIVGPDNLMEIPLEAQSLDITVNRNASAFPTPNNIVGRVAIDTNIPEIDIEIGGIFQDDVETSFDIEKTKPNFEGGDVVFNFASIVPTNNLTIAPGRRGLLDLNYLKVQFKSDLEMQSTKTGSIDIFDTPSQRNPVETNMFSEYDLIRESISSPAEDTINHPSSGTYSAGSTSIVLDSINGFGSQRRIHDTDGNFLGLVTDSNSSSNSLTLAGGTEININDGDTVKQFTTTLFAPNGQVVGSVIDAVLSGPTDENEEHHIKKITLDSISVPIYENVDYYMTTFSRPPLESILNNKKITLFPNYWRVDGITNKRDTPLGVHLVFSSDMAHSDYQNVTEKGVQVNGSHPSVTQRGKHYPEFNSDGDRLAGSGQDVYIKVPIGGITTNANNGNPASTLALIVKKALELTDDVMLKGGINSSHGQTLPSAFTVTVGGPMLKVKQNDRPINSSLVSVLEPCLQFDASENFDVSDEGTIELAQIEFFTGGYIVNSASVSSKSAGDKVQDLIGIVSNAKKDRDLIRGIQIPYDSLIQSDAVTPAARNFFLTFGQQDIGAKGSSSNTLSASHKMIPGLLPGDLGGDPLPDRGDSFFDNIAEFTDTVGALFSFVGNLVGDTFVTLLSDPLGNDGGIRIIPEKLHVRYDAGNKYYAFSLYLKASDFVIGV